MKYTFNYQIKQFSGIINRFTIQNNIAGLAKTENKGTKGNKKAEI